MSTPPIVDTRSDTLGLWVGTSDGVAFPNDLIGSDWEIFQANYDSSGFYAYPNPFSPRNHNQIQNDGYVRFHTGQITSQELSLDIFNFAMERVYQQKLKILPLTTAQLNGMEKIQITSWWQMVFILLD